jgi:DNA replication protein DnaC
VSLSLPSAESGQASGKRALSAPISRLYFLVSSICNRVSNRAFEEWGELFGNDLLASAALDRLTHHAQTLIIRGASYRQRNRRKEVEGLPQS